MGWYIGTDRLKRWGIATAIGCAVFFASAFLGFAVAHPLGWPLGLVTFVVAVIWLGRRARNAYSNRQIRRSMEEWSGEGLPSFIMGRPPIQRSAAVGLAWLTAFVVICAIAVIRY